MDQSYKVFKYLDFLELESVLKLDNSAFRPFMFKTLDF